MTGTPAAPPTPPTDADYGDRWLPSHDDPLLIQAMDQRDSFSKMMFDVADDRPNAEQRAYLESDKELVWAGLRRALDAVTTGRPGILVDEQYGQGVVDAVRAVRQSGSPLQLAIPIEESGQEWFTLQWGEHWLDHLHRVEPNFVKILVRDNPDYDAAGRARQLDDLAAVSNQLRVNGFPLLYELIVAATPAQLAAVGSDATRFDTEVRPGLTASLIADNQARGVEPALWKLEGYNTLAAAQEVAKQARAGGRTTGLIVLGRNAPAAQVDHWLDVARRVPEYVGFAIGRSVWRELLQNWESTTHTDADRAVVENGVAEGYGHFVRTWLDGLDR